MPPQLWAAPADRCSVASWPRCYACSWLCCRPRSRAAAGRFIVLGSGRSLVLGPDGGVNTSATFTRIGEQAADIGRRVDLGPIAGEGIVVLLNADMAGEDGNLCFQIVDHLVGPGRLLRRICLDDGQGFELVEYLLAIAVSMEIAVVEIRMQLGVNLHGQDITLRLDRVAIL